MSILTESENKLKMFKEGKLDAIINAGKAAGQFIKNNKKVLAAGSIGSMFGGELGRRHNNNRTFKSNLERGGIYTACNRHYSTNPAKYEACVKKQKSLRNPTVLQDIKDRLKFQANKAYWAGSRVVKNIKDRID